MLLIKIVACHAVDAGLYSWHNSVQWSGLVNGLIGTISTTRSFGERLPMLVLGFRGSCPLTSTTNT